MIILLFGQDTYRAREKLNEIVEHYKESHKTGLSLKSFDGQDLDFQRLKEESQQASIFQEKKLVIIRNPLSNTKLKEEILKAAKDLLKSEDTFLLYEENNIKKNDRLLSLVAKEGKAQGFKVLAGQSLKSWYQKEVLKYKGKISFGALAKLVELVGSDLWQASSEIKKLINFKQGKEIEEKDVELLVRGQIETDIFRTIDAIGQKNKKLALSLLHKHLDKGDHPLYLLTMINYQFRNLLLVKDLADKGHPYHSILRKSRLHPFVVRKSLAQARSFSLPELKKIYQKLFQVDLAIKTGKTEAQAALDVLVVSL